MQQNQTASPILRVVPMIVVTAGAAICFPAIKLGLAYAAFREPLDSLELSGIAFILAGIFVELLRAKTTGSMVL